MSPIYSWKKAKLCFLFLFSTTLLLNAAATESLPANNGHKSSQSPLFIDNDYFYLGAKVGVNRYQHACESWNINCDDGDLAGGIFGGYQFNDYFAVETSYLSLGEASASYLETDLLQEYLGEMRGLEISALASIPLTDNLSTFLKAGTFMWTGTNQSSLKKLKGDGWAPTAGVGLSYQLSQHWQARVEYQYFHELGDDNLGSSNSHLTSLGIVYQFGQRSKPLKKSKAAVVPVKKETVTKPLPLILPDIVIPRQKFNLLFAFDDSKLLRPQKLSPVANQLKQYSQSKVILNGYTDSKGSKNYNFKLSKKRVNSVKNYLISQGVKPEQISSNYFGSQSPFIDNLTAENRGKNRRVSILVPSVTLKQKNSSVDVNEGVEK